MITNLKNIDQQQLLQHLNSINPTEILSQLGYEGDDASKILKGDVSPILDKTTPILDCDTILHFHGQHLNTNLIHYFFKVAKNGGTFTEDEIKNYFDTYQKWFELVFKVGESLTFEADPETKDLSVNIKVKDDLYLMSIIDEVNVIIHQSNNSTGGSLSRGLT